MSNRLYRLVLGVSVLVALYFELPAVSWALVLIAGFETITNVRVPGLVSRLRFQAAGDYADDVAGDCTPGIDFYARTSFEAERVWRGIATLMLLLSLIIYPDALWALAWFMGFAFFGAGISGVCPLLLVLKWAGFR